MLNRLTELLDHLATLPNATEGHSARTLYTEGMKFGLTCKEVNENFLGKEKAISRGKYPATVSDELLAASKAAPAPKAKKVAAKKAAKPTKTTRNSSTAVIEKAAKKDDAAMEKRRDLIAQIAKRHAAEDKVIADLTRESSKKDDIDTDDGTNEEFETLSKASVIAPN